ncbi:hypothetical protein BMS3Abin16_00238 [archaeon BMS3Abin16]|nr:hypothetical protein BMS3Abin16_00238 [archaeon BMS3Abin16]
MIGNGPMGFSRFLAAVFLVSLSALSFKGLRTWASGALLRRGEEVSKAMEKMLLTISLIVILYPLTFQSFSIKYIRLDPAPLNLRLYQRRWR